MLGSGICILSAFPIIDTFFYQWPINGYIHRIQHGDWFGGKGVGLCKVKTHDGTLINVYSTHVCLLYTIIYYRYYHYKKYFFLSCMLNIIEIVMTI